MIVALVTDGDFEMLRRRGLRSCLLTSLSGQISLLRSSAWAFAIAAGALTAASAHAQASSEPTRVEFTLNPGGGMFVAGEQLENGFSSYRLGGGVTVNLTWFVAVEAEVGSSFGISRQLDFGVERKPPHTLDYNANLVFSAQTNSPVVPYVTGGAGALTLFSREELDIDDNETYFTGNVGGGVKWFTRNGRWGVRGGYRFLAVRSKSDAPAFFGRTNRYAHRVYGGLIVNLFQGA